MHLGEFVFVSDVESVGRPHWVARGYAASDGIQLSVLLFVGGFFGQIVALEWGSRHTIARRDRSRHQSQVGQHTRAHANMQSTREHTQSTREHIIATFQSSHLSGPTSEHERHHHIIATLQSSHLSVLTSEHERHQHARACACDMYNAIDVCCCCCCDVAGRWWRW